MTVKSSEWVHHRVSLSPRTDANMRALARQIGGDQGTVFDNSFDLYSKVKSVLQDRGGGTLYVEDTQGHRTEIEVR